MHKLNNPSRIIIAIASISLIGCLFVPLWRIDLFAPQYPEGLTMKIWHNDIKGEIDIINGLNHYIGMRHIGVDMFPEFQFIAYVILFYILLGLLVALYGKREILFWYLVLTVFGGVFTLYDFYRWGYEYGHNLDPAAAIKVPGLSYQPPILGHKRLLNFDAYSLPDIGAWMIIIAASIMVLIWIYDTYRYRRLSLKTVVFAIPLLFFTTSCSVSSEPIKYGSDICHTCKMGIIQPGYAAELVTKKGKVYKFDDVGCMVLMLKSDKIKSDDILNKLVIQYGTENNFINAEEAFYLHGEKFQSPMNFNLAAMDAQFIPDSLSKSQDVNILKWAEIYQSIAK
jgi:copper chaperone NosL